MSAEALAHIDAVLNDWDRSPYAIPRGMVGTVEALRDARAEIVRLSAPIPEPPTDDEQEALVKGFADVIFAAGLRSPESTKAVIAFKESLDGWRNRPRGPITDDEREALTSVVRTCTTRGLTYEQAAAVILAEGFRHRGPISDEERELLAEARLFVETWDRKGSWSADSPIGMIARLTNALEAARDTEAGR